VPNVVCLLSTIIIYLEIAPYQHAKRFGA